MSSPVTEPDTEVNPLLTETATRMMSAGRASEAPADAPMDNRLWAELLDSGFTRVGTTEEAGGADGTLAEAVELVRISGYTAAQVPLGEAVLVAVPALARVGLPLPDGVLTFVPGVGALSAESVGSDTWRVSGSVAGVPWARVADHAVAVATGADGPVLVSLPAASLEVTPGRNLADEPRDTIVADGVEATGRLIDAGAVQIWERSAALTRAAQIAGAVERVLEMTVRYAKERQQFGRPIVRFQAVSHRIAQLAEHAASARMAVEIAAFGISDDDVAVAKIIAGEAATQGATHAHQVFGAMGTTQECDLHVFSRRLWSWRDECGSERQWAQRLGADLGHRDADGLWHTVTAARGRES